MNQKTKGFVEIFNYLLKQANLTLTDIARETRIPITTLHNILSGKSPDPKLSILNVLADKFGISIDQLTGRISLPKQLNFNNHIKINRKKSGNLYVLAHSTGTELVLRLENEAGKVIGTGRSGPANICYSVDESWININNALEQAVAEAKINLDKYYVHACFGLKGTEVDEELIDFQNKTHSFATLLVKSDGEIDCLGAHKGTNGEIIIIDEGIAAYQLNKGKWLKMGGWGFPHADEGCAAWIGLQAVRLTFQWKDGIIEPSPMLEAMLERYSSFSKLVNWALNASQRDYSRIAHIVFDHLKENEPNALRIIKLAAQEIDKISAQFDKKSKTKLPCCLFGSLADIMAAYIDKPLKAKLIKPKGNGLDGASIAIRTYVRNHFFSEDIR